MLIREANVKHGQIIIRNIETWHLKRSQNSTPQVNEKCSVAFE